MDDKTALNQLQKCVLLEGLSADVSDQFFNRGMLREVSSSEVVVFEGHKSDSLFIVLSGVLSVEKATDAGPRCLAFLSPVTVFGELAMFHSLQRSSSVRAIDESVIFELSYSQLQKIIEHEPKLLWNLTALLANRLEAMNQRSLADSSSSKHLEVLNFISRMGDALRQGRGTDDIELILSPADIQQMTAVSKEIVVGAVEDLVQQKIAAIRSGKVHVLDLNALGRYSSEIRDWV